MSKKKIWTVISIIMLIIIIAKFVPFEQWLFRFDTAEDAIMFDYTAKVKQIIAKVEIGRFADITYVDKNGNLIAKHLEKDDKGWISPIKKAVISNKLKHSYEYTIVSYVEKNENLLIISNGSIEESKLIQEVSDSLQTKFEVINYEYNNVYHRVWIGIIEQYPTDYIVYLDKEQINL